MSEKISFIIDASVKGGREIVATTNATERLTEAIEQNRNTIKSVNQKLKMLDGFESQKNRVTKLGEQLDSAKEKYSNLGEAVKKQNKQTRELSVEYRKAEKEVDKLKKQMQSAGADGAQSLAAKLKVAQSKLGQLNNEMAESKQSAVELRADYRKTGKSVEELTRRKTKQLKKVLNLRKEMREAGLSTRRLADQQAKLQSQADKTTSSIAAQSKRMREMQAIQGRMGARREKMADLHGNALGVAAAAVPLGASYWASIQNEKQFAGVKKVVDASPEEAEELRYWAMRQAADSSLTSEQFYQLLEAGGQSGLGKNLDDLKQFALDAAKVGVAFDMSAEDAGGAMATYRSALSLDQNGAFELAAVINTLSNNSDGKVSAAQISGVMSRTGANAMVAGFSHQESAALASSLISTGMQEDVAATAMKNISGALTKGFAASGGQKEAMNRLGFDPEQLAAMMQEDASGTLLEVLDAIHAAPPEEQSALISQLFGEEAAAGVSILSRNQKLFTNALTQANKATEVHLAGLNKEYEAMMNTGAAGIDKLKNRLHRLAVIIGDALRPAIDWVTNGLSDLVGWLGDAAEQNQGATQAVAAIAGMGLVIPGAIIGFKLMKLYLGQLFDVTKLFRKRVTTRQSLDGETAESGRIANYAAKQWSKLNNAMRANLGPSSSGGDYSPSRDKKKRRRSRRRKGVRGIFSRGLNAIRTPSKAWNPKAAALSLGGGDLTHAAGFAGLAKYIKPLSFAMNGVSAFEGIMKGDGEQTGEALGDMGGAVAGGLAGAALGSVVPVIGTALGGIVGSVLGGLGGEELGGWIGRRLDPPEVTAEKIKEVQMKEAEARQQPPVNFAPVITVNPSNNQDEKAIAENVLQQMDQRYSYLMGGNTVSTRLGYAAIDRD